MQGYDAAREFIMKCYHELGKSIKEAEDRCAAIQNRLVLTGTYEHTYEELEHGARMAWRNSNRCIGRLFWKSLNVFDARDRKTPDDVIMALCRHIDFATNAGKIRPTITVFDPTVRIWNHQLVRYAGYNTERGIIGDPHSVAFTRACEELGWRGRRTPFDLLPMVIQ